MIALLCEINRARKKSQSEAKYCFTEETIIGYEKKYMEMISQGRVENKKTKNRYAKEEEVTLLNRLEKYSHNHLLFLHNFKVPFDDNMSERDLRKVKNRQKMAGGFRKDSGHEMYCSILTMPRTGTINAISATFIITAAVSISVGTINIVATVYIAPANSSLFTQTAATVTLQPPLTTITVGQILSGTATGLAVPVTAGQQVLLVFSASNTLAAALATTITGSASAGISIL